MSSQKPRAGTVFESCLGHLALAPFSFASKPLLELLDLMRRLLDRSHQSVYQTGQLSIRRAFRLDQSASESKRSQWKCQVSSDSLGRSLPLISVSIRLVSHPSGDLFSTTTDRSERSQASVNLLRVAKKLSSLWGRVHKRKKSEYSMPRVRESDQLDRVEPNTPEG